MTLKRGSIGVPAMTNTNIASLIFVVKSSQAALQMLTEQLPNAARDRIDVILRNIQKEAANLSSALARLSSFVEEIEVFEPNTPAVQWDDSLLETVTLMLESGDRLHCKICNGVLPKWDKDAQAFL